MRTAHRFKDLPTTYRELVAILPPRPIHSDAEHAEVQEMIDALAGFDLNADQADYLQALTIFFSAYEREHYPID